MGSREAAVRIGFATGYDPALPVRAFVESVREVEARGWEIAFFSETIALMRDSVSALSAFAMATERLTLGATQVVRLRSPVAMAQTAALVPNEPIGVGKGIHPGRVVWTREAKAARWRGSGEGHWWEDGQTEETLVDTMMSSAIRQLAGASTDGEAWNALFQHFNRAHGNGAAGYAKGEKVMVKVNFVGLIFSGRAVDPETYALVRQPDGRQRPPEDGSRIDPDAEGRIPAHAEVLARRVPVHHGHPEPVGRSADRTVPEQVLDARAAQRVAERLDIGQDVVGELLDLPHAFLAVGSEGEVHSVQLVCHGFDTPCPPVIRRLPEWQTSRGTV